MEPPQPTCPTCWIPLEPDRHGFHSPGSWLTQKWIMFFVKWDQSPPPFPEMSWGFQAQLSEKHRHGAWRGVILRSGASVALLASTPCPWLRLSPPCCIALLAHCPVHLLLVFTSFAPHLSRLQTRETWSLGSWFSLNPYYSGWAHNDQHLHGGWTLPMASMHLILKTAPVGRQ